MLLSCDGTYDESVYTFQNSKFSVSTVLVFQEPRPWERLVVDQVL